MSDYGAMFMPMLTFVNKIKAYGYATNVEELMEDPTFWSDNIDNNKWDEWFYGNLNDWFINTSIGIRL